MSKDSPSPPSPPDPNQTAAAQTGSNIQTAVTNATLNRTNQVTPWGSLTYTPGQPDANGVAQWTATTTLSPQQQALLDAQMALRQGTAEAAASNLSSGNFAMASHPIDYSQLNPLATSVASPTTGMTDHVSYGNIQDRLDTSNVSHLVGGNDLLTAMEQAQNASYGQARSRLDPQFTNMQSDLESKLLNQGIAQGSAAWQRAQDEFQRGRTDAYQTAQNNAVTQGNAAEAQLYGQGLASNQNAFGQAVAGGQFTNSAQAQGFGQGMANAQLSNSVNAQQFNQGLANVQLNNAARNEWLQQVWGAQNQAINAQNALASGAQIQQPSFQQTPQSGINPTDIAGIINGNYNQQVGLYNSQVGSNNATMGVAGNVAAAAIMAY